MRRLVAIAALLVVAACRREQEDRRPRLEKTLTELRTAIAQFRDDNGRGPHTLEELVPRYLPRVPADPLTGSTTTWRLTTEEKVQPSADFSATAPPPSRPEIMDVHSGAPGADRDGRRWGEY